MQTLDLGIRFDQRARGLLAVAELLQAREDRAFDEVHIDCNRRCCDASRDKATAPRIFLIIDSRLSALGDAANLATTSLAVASIVTVSLT